MFASEESKDSLETSGRCLQYLHTFAPLRPQHNHFIKIRQCLLFCLFPYVFQQHVSFCMPNVDEMLSEFLEYLIIIIVSEKFNGKVMEICRHVCYILHVLCVKLL